MMIGDQIPQILRLGSVEKGDYVRIRWGEDKDENQVTGMVTAATKDSVHVLGATDQKSRRFFYQDDTEVEVLAKQKEYDFI